MAGGASGRAGPRTIFVEGTGSSGNLSLSYRFYPEDQEVSLCVSHVSCPTRRFALSRPSPEIGRCWCYTVCDVWINLVNSSALSRPGCHRYQETKQEELPEFDAMRNGGYPRRRDVTAGMCSGRDRARGGVGEENRSERWGLIPLSPDALSGFSKEDPDVYDRNQEVNRC